MWAEEPDQYVHHTEGPAVVGVAEESCGHELATTPFAKVVRISVVALKVWPQMPLATLDYDLGNLSEEQGKLIYCPSPCPGEKLV